MPPVEPDGPAPLRPAGSTRRTPVLLIGLALLLLAARVAIGLWENRHPPRLADLVRWRPIASAEAEARQVRKPLLYDFSADWCAPCQKMQREVFADRAVADRIESLFVPVRVLDRRQEEGRNPAMVDSLQQRFHVASFPTLVVVPANGGEPIVLVGYQGMGQTIQALTEAGLRAGGPMRLRVRPPGTTGP